MKRKAGYKHTVAAAILAVATLVVACKPSVPGRYLQEDEMENILYEYYLADQVVATQGGDESVAQAYKDNILLKYGTTQEDFDSSVVYYTRHTQHLYDIYKRLGERLSNEAMAQGASASEVERFGDMASNGDTVNVWNGERAFVLTPHAATNHYPFSIDADTTYRAGDRLMLDMDVQYIFRDGARDGIAALKVRFANDSVASKTVRMTTASHYHLQIDDRDSVGIANVSGYVLLNGGAQQQQSKSLRLMIVSGVSLIRMHTK